MGSCKVKKKSKTKRKRLKCCLKNLRKKIGSGLVDRIIDKIPFEVHVPKYQFCGPGTHLEKRLARGDKGINPLDSACKTHDIAYASHTDSGERGKADKILQKEAFKRVLSRDASIGERFTALGVTAAMKIKRKISGKGLARKKKGKKSRSTKKKPVSFGFLIKHAKLAIKEKRPDDVKTAIKVASSSIKKNKKGKYIREPRTIKLPSIKGGVLPLIPIFAGLGALGSIIGSTASVVNTMNQARRGQRELEENKRHNKTLEAIAIGNKTGRGYYLHSPKHGKGYFLTAHPKNH